MPLPTLAAGYMGKYVTVMIASWPIVCTSQEGTPVFPEPMKRMATACRI
jgi:hypothetical protein